MLVARRHMMLAGRYVRPGDRMPPGAERDRHFAHACAVGWIEDVPAAPEASFPSGGGASGIEPAKEIERPPVEEAPGAESEPVEILEQSFGPDGDGLSERPRGKRKRSRG